MKYFILLVLCIYFYVVNLPESDTKKHKESRFILYSSFYYNISKLYSNDTLVMLFVAPKEMKPKNIEFDCFSVNITLLQTSALNVRLGHRPVSLYNNPWNVFIATCNTARNPHIIGLTVPLAPKVIEINVNYPIQAGYPVAICYPPMKDENRWQQLIFAIEVNKYFGTDMQIFYLNSASKSVMDILDIYEAKGWIRIEKYLFYDFGENMRMQSLNFSNHFLASSDCLMKYREAADYVIIADINDMIIPQQSSYYAEFRHWSRKYPSAAGFNYYKSNAVIDVSSNITDFSLSNAINSLKVEKLYSPGQTVFQTNIAEIVWFYFPQLNMGSVINIPPEEGKHHNIIMSKTVKNEKMHKFKNHSFIPQKDINAMQHEFASVFENFHIYAKNSINVQNIPLSYKRHQCVVNTCFFTLCPSFLKSTSTHRNIPFFSLSSYYTSCNFAHK